MATPIDPQFEARVRDSFATQAIMTTIGAKLTRVAAGEVEIELPFRANLGQQNGYVHAGIIATILDSACGYAAYSLIPAAANMLTVEFKINLLRPAVGEKFIARGRVVKPGKTLTICTGEAIAFGSNGEKTVAVMTSTLMTMLAAV
jgi:uncharacterized protein (TIGR00369 family)